VPLHSSGQLSGAQGPLKRSSLSDLPLFFSRIIVWLSFHLQFCLPSPVPFSIKTMASSMSTHQVAGFSASSFSSQARSRPYRRTEGYHNSLVTGLHSFQHRLKRLLLHESSCRKAS
jgi:hypothetical protein